jgi:hypothetical protein
MLERQQPELEVEPHSRITLLALRGTLRYCPRVLARLAGLGSLGCLTRPVGHLNRFAVRSYLVGFALVLSSRTCGFCPTGDVVLGQAVCDILADDHRTARISVRA